MTKHNSAILWFGLFILLFLLSLVFWPWADELILGLANYPIWIYFFLGLQLTLALLLMAFALTHWAREDVDDHKRE